MIFFALLLAACLAFSCFVAYLVGGGSGAAWGVFGPVGWIVAAVASLRRRAANEDARRRFRRRRLGRARAK